MGLTTKLSENSRNRLFLCTVLSWAVLICFSLAWNWYQASESAFQFAEAEARATYHKDLIYRRWASEKGGLYVPPTEKTPPNPYLSNIPDRDITTTDGKRLTLINPAYMTRQVHELDKEQYGVQGHITSLQPLNPLNAADPWETSALHRFTEGTKEVVSQETIRGQVYLRFMRPLITEKACLKCHAAQGYQQGEIRGGISVSVPFAAYASTAKQQQRQLLLAHLFIGGFGLFGLWQGRRMLQSSDHSLGKSREFHSNILHTAMDGFWVIDKQGKLLNVNETYCRLSGYSEQELLTMTVSDLEVNETIEETAAHLQSVFRQGEDRFESKHRRRDGTLIDVEIRAQHLFSEEDKIIVFLRDISERKQAERLLTESHSLLHNLADLVPGVIYQYRLYPDGRSAFPYASPGMSAIYEVTPEEVQSDATPVFGRLHPEDRGRVTEEIYLSARTLETYYCEFRVVLPRQGLRWRWSQAQPQRMTDGSTLWHGIISDITERKRAEEALKAGEDDLKESQRIAHVGTWRLDLATNQVVWSEELHNMYDHDPSLPPPPYTEHHTLFTTESWGRLSVALQKTRDTGVPYDLELETLRSDGRHGWMWVHGMSIQNSEGETIGLRGVSQDITDRKKAEEEKEKLNHQLIQAQKMESVGRLAGGVAHDFNNMLGVILGYTEMALEKVAPGEPLHSELEEVWKAAKRSADITRQLLAFSRRQPIAPKTLDLNSTIEGMLKMLRRVIGENIDLAWKPKATVCPVKMDPSQIDQILVNLCVNARDAISDVGTITIETGVRSFDESYCIDHRGFLPGDYVMLAISDNGCGMSKETQANIFEPFFTTKETGKGTGLGLATVYGIVKQNSGLINIYSEPEHGSSFRIYLPRHESALAPSLRLTGPDVDLTGRETILLVEDEATILRMTMTMLESLGYHVISATKPDEAIEAAHHHSSEIHLLMTDVVMPGMNGRQLAKTLQTGYPDLKVVFTSGYTANVIAHQGVLEGGVNFIQKPFAKKDLAKKLREVFDGALPW